MPPKRKANQRRNAYTDGDDEEYQPDSATRRAGNVIRVLHGAPPASARPKPKPKAKKPRFQNTILNVPPAPAAIPSAPPALPPLGAPPLMIPPLLLPPVAPPLMVHPSEPPLPQSELDEDEVPYAPPPPSPTPPPPVLTPIPPFDRTVPYRTPYKLAELVRLGYVSPKAAFKVHRVPRFIAKRQQKFGYYHVHGYRTWMIDIVFIKTDGSEFDLSDADAAVLREAQKFDEEHPEPAAGEGEDEEQKEQGVSSETRNSSEDSAEVESLREQYAERVNQILEANKCKKVLLCIHCNSRLVKAFIIPDQKALTLIPHIKALRDDFHCDTIISDAQGSIAKAIRDINTLDVAVAEEGVPIINHIKLNMSAKSNQYFHTMLSLVDRMCRTLRDMIYNTKFNNPTLAVDNELLLKLCDIYNNFRHDRLTEIMGFPITPQQMFDHPTVQEEFIRRLSAHNYRLRDINNMIPTDEIVRVWNKPEPFKKRRNTVEDDEYKVLGYDGRYFLQNLTTGKKARYLRSQIVRY